MATFKYRAKESTGNTIEGVVEAESTDDAIEKISRLGYLPIRVEESTQEVKKTTTLLPAPEAPSAPSSEKKGLMTPIGGGRVKSKDITAFSRQLSSLIKSGVPILRAIAIIVEPIENPAFKKILTRVHDEIKNGRSFSATLSDYPKLFPPIFRSLVAAGETSGNLDQTLARITDYRQKQEEIYSRLRSAMTYPALMALTGAGTIIFMVSFVMPKLLGVFATLGGNLPLPTQILIRVSDFFQKGGLWAVLGGGALLYLALQAGKKNRAQQLFFSGFKLRVPILGTLVLRSEIARFSRTLELLIKSGIPILKAIETTTPVMENEVLKVELVRCLQELKEGGSFGKGLRKSKLFPVLMTNLVIVGEESGRLDEALSEIANFYERETDEALRIMTSLMEPLLILVMGLVVGFIVIAMLLPMFELNLAVK